MFLAAFAEADIVGTCDRLEDPAAPVWPKVHLTNAEALGCGTIAYDKRDGHIRPAHPHIARPQRALGIVPQRHQESPLRNPHSEE